jgi:hypothetical protein
MWAAGAAVTTVAAIGAVGAGAKVPAHAAGFCQTRSTTVSGVTGFKFCGPGSAKAKTGGQSYSFKGGGCTHNPSAGLALQLSIGYSFAIINEANPNEGKPRFMLQIGKKHNTGTLQALDSGGKELAPEDTNVKVTWKGKTPLKGTFKGPKISGSWSCAGHIYNIQTG